MANRSYLIRALAFIFALNILLITAAQSGAFAAYRRGSTGETVTAIQDKLSRWGYYDGPVDGIFGSGTERAVRYFQSKNGLTVDGVVGNATLAALGLPGDTGSASRSAEVELLARLISAEARGEPYIGQL